ncbi:MAG: hypothetical protein EOM14_10880 [Clostridia bacterium]|nr:hypothetical protein [Clostridia bacterium]
MSEAFCPAGGGTLDCSLLYIYSGQTTGSRTINITSDAVYSLYISIYGAFMTTYAAKIKNGALTEVVNNAPSLSVSITNGVLTIQNNYSNNAMITMAEATIN